MLARTLIACVVFVSPMIGQEQAPPSAPDKKVDPRIERFLGKRDFFSNKSPGSGTASIRIPDPRRSEVCSIPLTDVTPPVTSFMPKLKPRPNTHPMAIAPPAPACEERRKEPPASQKKDPDPREKGSGSRP